MSYFIYYTFQNDYFFPYPKKKWEISPEVFLRRSGTKKTSERSLTLARGRSGERSLAFFVPDLRRIIREGEISRGFLGKGKKSIDLESVVYLVASKKIWNTILANFF